MEFDIVLNIRKVQILKNKDSKEIKLVTENFGELLNVADNKNFVANVEKMVLSMQKLDYQKNINLINELRFSGETPTDEQNERAEDSKIAIALIDKALESIDAINTENKAIIHIVACHILGRSYHVGVATLDTLLRKYRSALVNDKNELVLDDSVRKVFVEIKKELGKVAECYNTSKDSIFKEFKPRFNDRHVIDLCHWFYDDIKRNSESGMFNTTFKTDGTKKTNYTPLQSYVQRLVLMLMQRNNK